jgi:ParB-like chromosome segregation protein Spo0J
MSIKNEGTESTDQTEIVTTEAPVPEVPEVPETPDAAPKNGKMPEAKKNVAKEPDTATMSREKKIYQARRDFFIIDDEHNRTKQPKLIDEYARTIPLVGIEKALLVKVVTDENGNKRGLVFDGMHRLHAFDKAVEAGLDPESIWIPYTNDSTLNDEQRDIVQLRRNTNANMLPFDEAMACDRLLKRGWTRDEIAKHSGKTTSHIAQILPLCAAPKEVHRYLIDSRISATLLLEMLKIHKGDWNVLTPILRNLIAAKEASEATGKKAGKITDADVKKSGQVVKITKVHKRFDKIIADLKDTEPETDEDRVKTKSQVKLVETFQKIMDLMETDPQKALNLMVKKVTLV